jgi:acyl carrier protein
MHLDDADNGRDQAPADQTEAVLVDIWQRLLQRTKLSVQDNFFALGGDSLAAASMTELIEQAFGVDISLVEILRAPTIAELAVLIRTQLPTSVS